MNTTNPLPERLTAEKYTGLIPGWRYGSQAAGEPWMVTIPKDLAHEMATRYNACSDEKARADRYEDTLRRVLVILKDYRKVSSQAMRAKILIQGMLEGQDVPA